MHSHPQATQAIEPILPTEDIIDSPPQSTLEKERLRRARLARIQEIQDQGKTTTSTSWYFLAWNLCVSTAVGIQETFRAIARDNPIFALIYPDHPGTKEILGAIGFSVWSMALKTLSPVALAFSWINTAIAFKQLWQKETKSVWDYTNAFLSLASSVAWSVLLGLGAAGAGAVIAGALASVPYLIPAVFGVYAAYGLAKCAKNCYLAFTAWRQGKKEECKAYLWNAGKQLISVVTNTLALVTSLFLGVKMQEAVQLIQDNFEAGKQAINACFDKAAALLYALGTSAGIGIALNATEMNKQTLNIIVHPVDSVLKAWYAAKANPLAAFKAILTAPIQLPLRIAAIAIVGPVQGLFKLAANGFSRLFRKGAAEPVIAASIPPEAKNPLTHLPEEKRPQIPASSQIAPAPEPQSDPHLKTEPEPHLKPQPKHPSGSSSKLMARLISSNECLIPEQVNERILVKMKEINKSFPSMKHAPGSIVAKHFQLEELSKFVRGESRYRSVEEIEREAKLISRQGLYRSLFRKGGSEVKELTEDVRRLAAPAA